MLENRILSWILCMHYIPGPASCLACSNIKHQIGMRSCIKGMSKRNS